MGKLDGKVALITGAGQGIGKTIALRFASEGADIVVNDINTPTMEAITAEIVASGRKSIAVKADVSRKAEVDSMVATAIKAFKKVDILVNNAGITRHAPFLDMSEEDWDNVITVDLKGTFLCTQAVARHMVKQQYGKIINIASAVGLGAVTEFMPNYASAKAGVIAQTKVAAKAFGKYGINVNAIAPGALLTDIQFTRRTQEEFEAFVASREKVTVLGRMGEAEDIATVALFLASDETFFITGTVISSDGGRFDKL